MLSVTDYWYLSCYISAMFPQKLIWRIGSAFSFFGILLALYILWERFFQPAFQPCNVNSIINCTAIISGSVSTTLGIPTAIFGLIGYIALLVATFFKARKTFLATAILGLLFCVWIGYQELFLLRVVCPVCILCDLDMLFLFLLGIFLQKNKEA